MLLGKSVSFTIVLMVMAITNGQGQKKQKELPQPIDKNATKETKALFKNMKELSGKAILFGHQDATLYGHGWTSDTGRSDVKTITGSHPAVIGVDFSGFSGLPENEMAMNKERIRNTIINTYNRGGITTVSWHLNNPLSEGGFYWKDSVSKASVHDIIPGAEKNIVYKNLLKDISAFLHTLRGKDGKQIPLIFRPFHEQDGNWFWWGKSHCSKEDFISLWRFTVTYLKDSLKVHTLLYAFSPDCTFNSESDYLERFPGNKYADLLGMDNYADMGRDRYDLQAASRKLKIISDYAEKNGKLAALTETGLESIPNTNWWTGTLLKVLKTEGLKLSYVLVWRNDQANPKHFFAPYPGQVSVPDFLKFFDDPFMLFEKDLLHMYQ